MDNVDYIISTEWDGKTRRLIALWCGYCGEKFYARDKRKNRSKFCSRKCSATSNSIRNTTETECWVCKEIFRKINSSFILAKHGIYFCSRECKDKAQRIDGGCNAIWPSHYKSGKTNYRERSRDRLKNGCVDCGEKRLWLLQIHHIDGNRSHNKRDNLEVVCNNGHQKRHLRFDGENWIRDNKSLTPRDLILSLGKCTQT